MTNSIFTLGKWVSKPIVGIGVVPNGQRFLFDLNGDGLDDLILTGAYYPFQGATPIPEVGAVFFGTGSGFSLASESQFPINALATIHSRELVTGDFNEDGLTDIFLADHGYDAPPFPGEQNHLFLSRIVGGVSSWIDATAALPALSDFTHSATVGDVNGDGHLDVFAGNFSLSQAYILLGDGRGSFTKVTSLLPLGTGQALANSNVILASSLLADLDGDGRPELILGTNFSSKSTQILWNEGGTYSAGETSALPTPKNFGTGWLIYDVQVTDINFDGRPDLLLNYQADVNNGGWYLQVLINQGNRTFLDQTETFIPNAPAITGGLPTIANKQAWIQFLIPTDFNNDGRIDFFVDGKPWGGAIPQDSFPVLLIHQADGTFATETVGTLRSAGVPDAFFWGLGHVDRGPAQSGELIQGPFVFNGSASLNSMSIEFAQASTHWLAGSIANDALIGSDNSDEIAGFNGNDLLTGGKGNDTLIGGDGVDTAIFTGGRVGYTISFAGTNFIATDRFGTDGTDTLTNIERLQFADAKLAIDMGVGQSAGETALLMGTVLPGLLALDASKQALLGSVLGLFDAGYTLQQLSGAVMRLPIWDVLTGHSTPTNTDIASYLLTNVNGHAPDQATLNAAVTELNSETGAAQGLFLANLAASAAGQTHIGLVGLAQTGLAFV